MIVWRQQYHGVETLNVAVMGCIVNGPGESKHADIGISLPGTGESPAAPVFIDGQKAMTLRGEGIADEFIRIVDDYVARRFGGRVRRSAAQGFVQRAQGPPGLPLERRGLQHCGEAGRGNGDDFRLTKLKFEPARV